MPALLDGTGQQHRAIHTAEHRFVEAAGADGVVTARALAHDCHDHTLTALFVLCNVRVSRPPAAARSAPAYAPAMLARKDELGNRAAFCAGCGWGRRFLAGVPADLPETCPDCGQPVLAACPACGEPITSLMQITCSACAEALRDAEFFGRPIRRKPERHVVLGAGARSAPARPRRRSRPRAASRRPAPARPQRRSRRSSPLLGERGSGSRRSGSR